MEDKLKEFIDKQNRERERLIKKLKICKSSEISMIKEEFDESSGKAIGAIFALNLIIEEKNA